jgi:TRAP-type C4-dicarboxylate transport system substrate-binding protein
MDTDAYKALESRMEAMGIKPLTKCYAAGSNNFCENKRPVNKWEDLKGLKFSTQPSKLITDSLDRLGATAIPLPPPELPGALETGMVDGHMGAFWPMAFIDYINLEPYICVAPNGWFQLGIVASTKWWNTLPSDLQQILSRIMADAVQEYRQLSLADNEKYYNMYKDAKTTTLTIMSKAEIARAYERLMPLKEELSADPHLLEVFKAAEATR